MLARARKNQAGLLDASNVFFVEGKITSIPLEDGIADCIISNCVINLVPEVEKPTVFAEMARLLRSGGRVAISDILARKPLPDGLRESVALYVGCVAGASTKDGYTRWLKEAGFGGKQWRVRLRCTLVDNRQTSRLSTRSAILAFTLTWQGMLSWRSDLLLVVVSRLQMDLLIFRRPRVAAQRTTQRTLVASKPMRMQKTAVILPVQKMDLIRNLPTLGSRALWPKNMASVT